MGRLVELKVGEIFSRIRRKLGRICVVELEYTREEQREKVYRWTEIEPRVKGIFKKLGIILPQVSPQRFS